MGLSKHTGMNDYLMELEEGRQPPYGLIYSPSLVKLETLKTYIKIYLKTGSIQLSKSSIGVLIFFDWKQNRILHLCVDFKKLNNLTMKNRYLLSLIDETLDRLG